ncbi:Rieske (2Fe-2S) protein [Rhizobium sp. LjRoot254]|uniref:Rieske (2Fe-2S) protein n=1 Tax=Rhizobium sp. LjRoot254 TaxID=3342297 RepID=UPI003ECD40EC
MAEKFYACKASEVAADAATIIKLRNLSVGIFKVKGDFFAMLNVCPHRGAALCEGPVCGTSASTDRHEFRYERRGELVRCAWHGWEFDIRTGEFIVDPKIKARTFPVTVEGDDIFVHA